MNSWVATATGSDFDSDNVPLGIFSPRSEAPRPGVAIGDSIADLTSLFLEDGDIVSVRDRAVAVDRLIAFGERRGTIIA